MAMSRNALHTLLLEYLVCDQ